MGLLYQAEDKDKIKANLSVFFVYINMFGIAVLWFTDAAGHDDLELFLKCIPAILTGWFLSFFINRRVNEELVRKLILLVATFAGAVLILSNG